MSKRVWIACAALLILASVPFSMLRNTSRLSSPNQQFAHMHNHIDPVMTPNERALNHSDWQAFIRQQKSLRGIPVVIFRSSSKFFHTPLVEKHLLAGTQQSMLDLETYLAGTLQVRVFSVQASLKSPPVVFPNLIYAREESIVNELVADVEDVVAVVDVRRLHSSPQSVRASYPLALWVYWAHDHFSHNTITDSFKHLDVITTVSKTQAKLWENVGPRVYPIYNPVHTEEIQLIAKSKQVEPFKLFSYSSKSNLERMRQLMQKLVTIDPRYQLYISSPMYFDSSVPEDATELHMHFLGHLSHTQALEHVATSAVVVFPNSYHETFGYCVLEPPTLGTFIATSDVQDSAAREVLACAGVEEWLTPLAGPFDAEAWATTVHNWTQQAMSRKERVLRSCEEADHKTVHDRWRKLLRLGSSSFDNSIFARLLGRG